MDTDSVNLLKFLVRRLMNSVCSYAFYLALNVYPLTNIYIYIYICVCVLKYSHVALLVD